MRKRRTLRLDHPFVHHGPPRRSHTVLSCQSLCEAALEPMIKGLVLQILVKAEGHFDTASKSLLKCKQLLDDLTYGIQELYQLEMLALQPHSQSCCEPEPRPAGPHDNAHEWSLKQLKNTNRRRSLRCGKEPSQNCDTGQRRRMKIEKESQQLRKCSRNQMISLGHILRNSESQDHSVVIQQLLRRKKELQLENKQPQTQRNITEPLKTTIFDKKDRKFYAQSDEGSAFEIILSNPVKFKQNPPAIKLNNVKVLPGQQIAFPTTIRRKPIVQMAIRNTKRRKQAGDTCVFIEQLRESQLGSMLDQEFVIEEACQQKGVRIAAKDISITSITRLPTLR